MCASILHLIYFADEKYTFLDTRSGYTPPQVIESSFKHYPEMIAGENGPELINMTASSVGGGMGTMTSSSLLQPDSIVDVTMQRSLTGGVGGGSAVALNNGSSGVATLPRSSLAKRSENHTHSQHVHSHHGTLLKRSVDELRTTYSTTPTVGGGAVIVTSASVGGNDNFFY